MGLFDIFKKKKVDNIDDEDEDISAKDGGKVVFAGDVPRAVDAVPSERGLSLASKSECVSFTQSELLRALESVRQIEICDESGKLTDNLLYNMRADGCGRP